MTRRLTIATLIALGLFAPRADAGMPCDTYLSEQAFRCQVRTAPDAAPSQRCLHFLPTTRGLATGRILCSCAPRGKIAKITFDASAEFTCAGTDPLFLPDGGTVQRYVTMTGAATRTAIRRGFLLRDDGLAESFECVLDPTCASVSD